MNDGLRITVIVFALLLFLLITYILKKGRVPIKYALVWYFADFAILIAATFPMFVSRIAHLVGFETMANMILCLLILILIYISIILTIIVAGQTTKIRLLIQEVSMLKEKIDKK